MDLPYNGLGLLEQSEFWVDAERYDVTASTATQQDLLHEIVPNLDFWASGARTSGQVTRYCNDSEEIDRTLRAQA